MYPREAAQPQQLYPPLRQPGRHPSCLAGRDALVRCRRNGDDATSCFAEGQEEADDGEAVPNPPDAGGAPAARSQKFNKIYWFLSEHALQKF